MVQYLAGDHLGTTTTTFQTRGTTVVTVAEARHYPYGAERWHNGTLPTDYRFTGQREEAGLGGIYHMGARWYDPYINRWTSPDTIMILLFYLC